MSNKHLTLALVAVAIIALGGYFLPTYQSETPFGGANCNNGNCTDFDAVNVTEGYYVDDTNIITGAGTWIGTIVAAAKATFDAGILHSYTSSTSTIATAQTLVAADITNYESVIFTPNRDSVTLTFPASSTLSAFVPTAGDWAEQCWYNATTTAAKTITFAAGTGIDLERIATSTISGSGGPMLAIPAGGSACIKYVRQPATASTFDISVLVTNYIDAD